MLSMISSIHKLSVVFLLILEVKKEQAALLTKVLKQIVLSYEDVMKIFKENRKQGNSIVLSEKLQE